MDGGALRFDFHAEFVAVADEFGFFQADFLPFRHHHAVTFQADRLHGVKHLGVFPAHGGHFLQHGNELVFAADGFAHQIAEHFIVVFVIHVQHHTDAAVGHADIFHDAAFDVDAVHGDLLLNHIADGVDAVHHGADFFDQIRFQLVGVGKHLHPFGHIEFNHGDGEFIEHALQNLVDVVSFQLLAVDRERRHMIFFADPCGCPYRLVAMGAFGVDQHQEGLMQLL